MEDERQSRSGGVSAGDPEAARYAAEKTTHVMGVAILRRLRTMVDREAHTEAAVRGFTIRALLWLAVIALSVPLAMFGIGAVRALIEHLSQGRPPGEYLARLVAEGRVMVLWVLPWAVAMWALVRHSRNAGARAAHRKRKQ